MVTALFVLFLSVTPEVQDAQQDCACNYEAQIAFIDELEATIDEEKSKLITAFWLALAGSLVWIVVLSIIYFAYGR